MDTLLQEAPSTPEETLRIEDGHRYEWIDGQWVEKKIMGAKAGLILLRIMIRVGAFAEARQLGLPFSSDAGYLIFPDTPKRVCYPDGSLIRRGRLPDDQAPEGHIHIAPDLALEVVSPNDLAYEVEQKVVDYLQAGVSLVWVVYPNTRHVMVYRRNGPCSRLTPGDELSGEDLLPGFTCRIADIFAGI